MGAVLRSLLACSFCVLLRGEARPGKVAGVREGGGEVAGTAAGRGLALGSRARKGPAVGGRARPQRTPLAGPAARPDKAAGLGGNP